MSLQKKLVNWYHKNQRDLPWRSSTSPYSIWVSEIILQQTRVVQGLSYYLRFMDKFPDIKTLAKASLDEVMLCWKGLGYYSRARNMHTTAKYINDELNGVFPDKYDDLLTLKGVGEYTAAAIASISFNEARPVIDGNVIRVYSRLFNIDVAFDSPNGKKEFKKVAEEMMVSDSPGDYNQSIMEFGATLCTPVNPLCNLCPVNEHCMAFELKKVNQLPIRGKKVSIKKRNFNFLILHYNNKIYIHKREGNDIWHSLYQFPLIETEKKEDFGAIANSMAWKNLQLHSDFKMVAKSKQYKHQLTHQLITARFFHIELTKKITNKNFVSIEEKNLVKYAIPRLLEIYWNDYQNKQ